jgi:tRNA dimethylallyltransferase
MKERLPLVTIMGPTGVGKTDLAIALSREIESEIISVDSVQVYKKLEIGSGKPSKKTLLKYPHKLLSLIEPWEPYSTALFVIDSTKEIDLCYQSKKLPILVGGTMLYFRSLLNGISRMPQADQTIRSEIVKEAKKKGWEHLHERLSKIDPESALRIHSNDTQRIQRALEVYLISSKTMSEWRKGNKDGELLTSHDVLQFSIEPENREILRRDIKNRFLRMLEEGLVAEVERLLKIREMDSSKTSMRSVGYRQVCDYLADRISYEEMVTRAINASRQLAKRQMTWLRGWKNLNWITQDNEVSVDLIKKKLKILE